MFGRPTSEAPKLSRRAKGVSTARRKVSEGDWCVRASGLTYFDCRTLARLMQPVLGTAAAHSRARESSILSAATTVLLRPTDQALHAIQTEVRGLFTRALTPFSIRSRESVLVASTFIFCAQPIKPYTQRVRGFESRTRTLVPALVGTP